MHPYVPRRARPGNPAALPAPRAASRRGPPRPARMLLAVLALGLLLAARVDARAQTAPYEQVPSRLGYAATVQRLEAAVADSPLNIVTRASATLGARALGVKIPGNLVLGLFAPQYAVRMLRASVDAGFEAPIRLYVVEDAAGRVQVRYRKPSVVFAPYGQPELDALARELDAAFAAIVASVR